jgi:hypothetical protein
MRVKNNAHSAELTASRNACSSLSATTEEACKCTDMSPKYPMSNTSANPRKLFAAAAGAATADVATAAAGAVATMAGATIAGAATADVATADAGAGACPNVVGVFLHQGIPNMEWKWSTPASDDLSFLVKKDR